MSRFITWTIKFGITKIDWFRTIYFSLFGSSALTFCLKIRSVDSIFSGYLFFLGVIFFGGGLITSMRIVDSLKFYEKEFASLNEESRGKIEDYIMRKENVSCKSWQHLIMYLSVFIALILIGWAGWRTEGNSIDGNNMSKNALFEIKKEVDEIRLNDNVIDSLAKENRQLVELHFQSQKLIDSLITSIGRSNSLVDSNAGKLKKGN